MQTDNETIRRLISTELTDVLVRVGLIAVLVYACLQIFAPFLSLMLWALILSVTLYPLQQKLAARLGGREGRSATLLVLAGLLLIGVPTAMLGSSLANHIQHLHTSFENSSFSVPQPDPAVAEWPLIGKKVYGIWNNAARDLPATLDKLKPQLASMSKTILDAVMVAEVPKKAPHDELGPRVLPALPFHPGERLRTRGIGAFQFVAASMHWRCFRTTSKNPGGNRRVPEFARL